MIFDLNNISYIGKTLYDADFGISQNDRRRHLHIIGQTGTVRGHCSNEYLVSIPGPGVNYPF